MTQSLEHPPEEGSPRERFRSDARAEARWRRHEIAGRISAIKNNLKHLEDQVEKLMKVAMRSVTKDRVFDTREAPKMLAGEPTKKRRRKKEEKPDG